MLILAASAGCEDECWLDLAIAESRGLYVVRDCRQRDYALLRLDPDDVEKEPVELSHFPYTRIAIGPDDRWAALSSRDGHYVDLFNFDPLSFGGESNFLAGNVGELAAAPDAKSMWVAEWGPKSGLALIDTEALEARAFIPFAGDPLAIAFVAEENAIVAAASSEGRVRKIDAARFGDIATATTSGALDFVLLEAPPRIALLEDRSQRIAVRELGALREVAALEIGAGARRIAARGAWLAVTEQGALRIFEQDKLHSLIAFDSDPQSLALTGDGRAFVGLADEDAIAIVDLARGEVTGRIEF